LAFWFACCGGSGGGGGSCSGVAALLFLAASGTRVLFGVVSLLLSEPLCARGCGFVFVERLDGQGRWFRRRRSFLSVTFTDKLFGVLGGVGYFGDVSRAWESGPQLFFFFSWGMRPQVPRLSVGRNSSSRVGSGARFPENGVFRVVPYTDYRKTHRGE
jgi:hypothetical protein